jgi:hypothetical protein
MNVNLGVPINRDGEHRMGVRAGRHDTMQGRAEEIRRRFGTLQSSGMMPVQG